jgi:hypothetical protein
MDNAKKERRANKKEREGRERERREEKEREAGCYGQEQKHTESAWLYIYTYIL